MPKFNFLIENFFMDTCPSRGYFNNRPKGAQITSRALKGVPTQDASRLRSLAPLLLLLTR